MCISKIIRSRQIVSVIKTIKGSYSKPRKDTVNFSKGTSSILTTDSRCNAMRARRFRDKGKHKRHRSLNFRQARAPSVLLLGQAPRQNSEQLDYTGAYIIA